MYLSYMYLTEEQLAALSSGESNISPAIHAFTGTVYKTPSSSLINFKLSGKKTKCLECKEEMPTVPEEMVIVITYEYHLHVKCLGKLLEKIEKTGKLESTQI